MSARWQCAVCEASNDGGDTCSACGATVAQTVIRSTPSPRKPARGTPLPRQRQTEVPVRELPVRATEREAPTYSYGGYDIYEYFPLDPRVDMEERYAGPESFDARPRVRVYGCCLPIALGMLLAAIGAATFVASLVIP